MVFVSTKISQANLPPEFLRSDDNTSFFGPKNNLTLSSSCPDEDKQLGYLNTTLTKQMTSDLARWKLHDDNENSFCDINDDDINDSVYLDLLLNPERYTGYKGESAQRIWLAIYKENCFK